MLDLLNDPEKVYMEGKKWKEKDPDVALSWFLRSKSKAHKASEMECTELATPYYLYERAQKTRDPDVKRRYLERAASYKSAEAFMDLAKIDPEKERFYVEQAAKLDLIEAEALCKKNSWGRWS